MRFTIPLLLLFFIPLPLPVSGKVPTPRQARPNIVFIFIDDMGYADPACFGNPIVKTPNIDRLAAEGIKLTNFYVNSPICSPSRVAVTTGQYPARWKIHSYLNNRAGNKSRGMADYLDKAAPTTAKKLKAAGYSTAHFGKWHMGGGRDVDDAPLPADYGFDESLVAFEGLGDRLLVNPKNSSTRLGHGNISFCERWEKTEKYTDRAIDFIRRNKDKPWYVRLFPNDVHDAHVPLPGTEEPWKAASDNPWQHKFFAVLKEMDRQIGRLVDEIDALGLAENTLIVFTSDNGPTDWPKYYRDNSGGPPGFTGPFLGRKWSLFEGGIRMPFIARWKGRIPEGIVDKSSMMGGIDLSPTFCSLAGVQVPQSEKLDGIDCSAVLLGKPEARPEPLYWQYGAPHAVLKPGKLEYQSPSFAIREGNWKFLINPDGSGARLFNLITDPGEQVNVLELEPARVAMLHKKLGRWAESLGFSFNSAALPSMPQPGLAVLVNRQLLRFNNHGVESPGKEGVMEFSGEAWLDLPRSAAPKVAGGKWLRVCATIYPKSPNGVILAHGGNKEGYSLYLKGGGISAATCVSWKRTVISAPLGDGVRQVEFFWQKSGEMRLKVDDKLVSRGKAPGFLGADPGDSLQIGSDLIKPVGDYQAGNAFQGTISGVTVNYAR
jgi:arylsulfatase A-like enzyme